MESSPLSSSRRDKKTFESLQRSYWDVRNQGIHVEQFDTVLMEETAPRVLRDGAGSSSCLAMRGADPA